MRTNYHKAHYKNVGKLSNSSTIKITLTFFPYNSMAAKKKAKSKTKTKKATKKKATKKKRK